jgi:hypothetical protein
MNAVFHASDLPIQEEPERAAAQLEIGQQLCLVDWQYLIDGFVRHSQLIQRI